MSYYIGAKDRIDQLLVKRYQGEKTNNLDNCVSIPVDRYWTIMNQIGKYEQAIRGINTVRKAV